MEEFFFKLGFMTQQNHEALIQELRALRTSVDALNEKISALATATIENHATLAKGIFSLASQTTADNHDVKESLANVEELLRLTAANQIMNLVDK